MNTETNNDQNIQYPQYPAALVGLSFKQICSNQSHLNEFMGWFKQHSKAVRYWNDFRKHLTDEWEDLYQEVLLALFKATPTFKNPVYAKLYLNRVFMSKGASAKCITGTIKIPVKALPDYHYKYFSIDKVNEGVLIDPTNPIGEEEMPEEGVAEPEKVYQIQRINPFVCWQNCYL